MTQVPVKSPHSREPEPEAVADGHGPANQTEIAARKKRRDQRKSLAAILVVTLAALWAAMSLRFYGAAQTARGFRP